MAETFAVWPAKVRRNGKVGFAPQLSKPFFDIFWIWSGYHDLQSLCIPEHGTVSGWTYEMHRDPKRVIRHSLGKDGKAHMPMSLAEQKHQSSPFSVHIVIGCSFVSFLHIN